MVFSSRQQDQLGEVYQNFTSSNSRTTSSVLSSVCCWV